jgi:uncharacterized protein YjdB
MIDLAKSTFSSTSSENFMLHSAQLYYGLAYNEGLAKFEAAGKFGATTGGVKVKINQAMRQAEIDGVLVKVMNNDYLTGTEITIDAILKEWTAANLRNALPASTLRDATASEAPAGYKVLEPKHKIETTDYIENLGIVGYRQGDDQEIIIIMNHGINVSGLGTDTANHTEAGIPVTFECRALDTEAANVGGSFKIYFPSAEVAATGITLNPTTLALTVGGIKAIVPTVAPAGATNKEIIWTTSAAAKATVDAYGHVTGVAIGTATITATTRDGGYTATCAVTVS